MRYTDLTRSHAVTKIADRTASQQTNKLSRNYNDYC